MPESGFYELLAECAADAGRVFRVAERRGAGPDHPERLGFPESRYLKCAVLLRDEALS
jgi:23S rRNA (cytosine1962-C5)-methyltransferase